MAEIHFGTQTFDTDLVIFDKDGTLIDFAGLWAHYTLNAVEALMTAIATNRAAHGNVALDKLRADLYEIMGYDPARNHFDSQSPVVTAPLPILYTLAAGVLYRHGWAWLNAELEVQHAFVPIMSAPLPLEMVRATTHLPTLFDALRGAGVQIAVVTSDDRGPTLAALDWLEARAPITFIACADDGYPYKPAPDAIWAACQATNVPVERTVMVGDSTTDMLMGQRAGVGLRVAVLTGVMEAEVLAPLADVVLASIGEIAV